MYRFLISDSIQYVRECYNEGVTCVDALMFAEIALSSDVYWFSDDETSLLEAYLWEFSHA